MPAKPPSSPRNSTKKSVRVVSNSKVVELRPQARAPAKPRRAPPAKPLAPLSPVRVEQALAEMAGRIAAPGGVAEAQRNQLAVIHALLEPKSCYVAQHTPGRDQLLVATVRGRNDARIQAVGLAEGPVGRAFMERQIVREDGLIAGPIRGSAESALGCLVLISPRNEVSDPLMDALCNQLAAAWEFARLRDDAARRNKDLQTAVAGLKSLEKNREELLSNVSHDLKNPLTTIKAYLTLLGRSRLGPLTDKQRKAVETCDRNSDRLLRMISDLLLISRLQSGKMELDERAFGLKAVAEEVLVSMRPLAEQSKVRFKPARGPEVFVRGDRQRLAEALHNLLDNAIHFSHPEGEVEVTVSDESGLACLSVRDQGVGIAAEDLGHVFDAYHRPRTGPSARRVGGLGLPIVAKIVHLHGGRVEVSSTVGAGSTFQIYLPVFAGAVSPIRVPAERRNGGILLVEDDADCREVLQQVLEEEGHRVIAVTSTAEARGVLENIRPGLVLLDLRLRNEDGRTVLHFIRETPALADLSVYLVSGATELASLRAGQGKDRIDGVFEKPLNLPQLLDTVAAVVRPSRAPAAPPPTAG